MSWFVALAHEPMHVSWVEMVAHIVVVIQVLFLVCAMFVLIFIIVAVPVRPHLHHCGGPHPNIHHCGDVRPHLVNCCVQKKNL